MGKFDIEWTGQQRVNPDGSLDYYMSTPADMQRGAPGTWQQHAAAPFNLGQASPQQIFAGAIPQNGGIVPLPPGPSSQGLPSGFASGMSSPKAPQIHIPVGGVTSSPAGNISPTGVTAPLTPLGYGGGAASAFARPGRSRLIS